MPSRRARRPCMQAPRGRRAAASAAICGTGNDSNRLLCLLGASRLQTIGRGARVLDGEAAPAARRAPATNRQRTDRRSAASSGGSSTGQRSNAYGQRGWKRQPLGGCAGSGTSPGRLSGRTPAPSARGTARDQRLGVGMCGRSQSGAVGAGFDHPPEVHHRHVIGDVADDRQIVGDQEQPDVELA